MSSPSSSDDWNRSRATPASRAGPPSVSFVCPRSDRSSCWRRPMTSSPVRSRTRSWSRDGSSGSSKRVRAMVRTGAIPSSSLVFAFGPGQGCRSNLPWWWACSASCLVASGGSFVGGWDALRPDDARCHPVQALMSHPKRSGRTRIFQPIRQEPSTNWLVAAMIHARKALP